MIVCSIDVIGGKAVQLEQGERLMIERDDVLALAEQFGRLGEIAVVDIDAARGGGSNRALIERLCSVARVRVGGGIRDAEAARRYLRAGAARVIIGTAATPELLRLLPRERTMVALDTRCGNVTTHGWRERTNETPFERAKRLAPYCGSFLFTDVDREGLLGGMDMEKVRTLQASTDLPLTAAGGICTVEEIRALDAMHVDAQVGMCVYTGRIDPVDAFVASIDFDRGGGLVPTIVCDASDGRVRMLAYSSPESLACALRDGRGIYWSRSRNELWRKGETSGATQRLVRTGVDCDRDALAFYVEQAGATCHRGTDRCFNDAAFGWSDLAARIDARARHGSGSSYTRRLLESASLLNSKVLEEADEVVGATDREDLAWECADLLYFLTVKMRANNIAIGDVMNQLAARAK